MTVASRHSTGTPGLWIGGESRAAADGGSFEVIDPSDGSVLETVPNATVEDAGGALDAAEAAASDWAARPPRERGEVLRRAFELMRLERQRIAELIVRENGKALSDALAETDYATEFLRWYSEEAVRLQGDYALAPSGANRMLVDLKPVGISVLVTPWNYPAAMATRKLGPALAAGCTAVLKPASETPLTALLLGELLGEAGLPAGAFNVLPSRGGATVAAMLGDPRVRKLSFTGSTEVGRELLAAAAGLVINCSMELGGNAPFLVLEDADLEAAVEGAMVAKLRNGGEACTAANRFYAHRSVAEEFSRRLAERMAAVRVGPGLDPEVELGPLVNEAACAKIDQLLEDARRRGAALRTGGGRIAREGFYYAPTVLDVADQESRLLHEEIFGPVAPVVAFDREEEAIAAANDTEYGLVAYVYSRDLSRGLAVSRALESGMIGLNRGLVSDPAAPFGGVKQSGIGREGGHEGVLDYCESQYVAFPTP